MGALTEIYVDPSIAANSGTGSIGDPYGDLQYALNNATRDTTNGTRFNIKAGTAEVLSATLDFTTFTVPTTNSAPVWFQGYTSAAGDGGIGAINGNAGNFSIFAAPSGHIWWKDLELYNTGSADIVQFGSEDSGLIHCKVHGTTANAVDEGSAGNVASVIGCYIYDFGGVGILLSAGHIHGNYIVCTTANNDAISNQSASSSLVVSITRNIISIQGVNAEGIKISSARVFFIANNSIYSTFAGTQRGIQPNGAGVCINNLIEGFSGTGGSGIEVSGSGDAPMVAHNATYNCETAYEFTTDVFVQANNATLGSSPFAKSGSDTFDNRFTFFAPVDTGTVHGGSYYAGSF